MGSILNAVSMGAAGSILEAAVKTSLDNIVDYADIDHIHSVVENLGDATVEELFKSGIEFAESKVQDQHDHMILSRS